MERVKNLVVVSPGCSDRKLGLVAAQRAWIVAIPCSALQDREAWLSSFM